MAQDRYLQRQRITIKSDIHGPEYFKQLKRKIYLFLLGLYNEYHPINQTNVQE